MNTQGSDPGSGQGTGPAKKTGKKKKKGTGTGTGSGAGTAVARRPQKKHDIPVAGNTQSAQQSVVPLGVPLEMALSGPLLDLQGAIDDVGKVTSIMALPRDIAAEGEVSSFLSRIYARQSVLSYLVGQGLDRVKRAGITVPTDTTSAALSAGQEKCMLFDQTRRTAARGQSMAADGQLFLGAKFTFFFKKLLDVYQRRLDTGTLEQKLNAVRAFGNVDRIRFRILSAAQQTRGKTQDEKTGLRTTLAQQNDAADFNQAQDAIAKGLRPEVSVLQGALRHAQRLDNQFGFGLSVPDIGQGAIDPPATSSKEKRNSGRK